MKQSIRSARGALHWPGFAGLRTMAAVWRQRMEPKRGGDLDGMTDDTSDDLAVWLRVIRMSEALAGSAAHSDVVWLLGGLRQLTDWDTDVLCRHLGFGWMETEPDRINQAVAYLTWITALCRKVDPSQELVRARREVVVGAFELCSGAGGPPEGRVERCGEAMRQPTGADFSANDLLELGEVAEAWRQAARGLPDGPAREAQERFDQLTPHLRTSHIHPRRLQLLLTGDAHDIQQHIGATVALRMHTHLGACTLCDSVVAELDLRFEHEPLLPVPRLRRVA